MKKKFLAILLAALMVMTLLPTVAMADGKTSITAVNLTVETDFNKLKLTVTPGSGEEQMYETPTGFYFVIVDKEGSLAYKHVYSEEESLDEWYNDEDEPIEVNNINWEDMSFLVWSFQLVPQEDYIFDESVTVNVNDMPFSEVEDDEELEVAISTGYQNNDDGETLYLFIKEDIPSNSGSANIKGVIDAADFAYELVIPADTILTEAAHENVLLGADGKVSIEVTKHSCDTIKVFYTVNLDNATLTDGETTITTTYGVSADGTNFTALAEETKYTVYNAGAKVDSFINVSANNDSWNNAPVGDYNATVVFNFDTAPLCKCGVDLTEYPLLWRVDAVAEHSLSLTYFKYSAEKGRYVIATAYDVPTAAAAFEGYSEDELKTIPVIQTIPDTDMALSLLLSKGLIEGCTKVTDAQAGDLFHVIDIYAKFTDIATGKVANAAKKCNDPIAMDVCCSIGAGSSVGGSIYKYDAVYSVPAGTAYSIDDKTLTIGTEEYTAANSGGTWMLNGESAQASGTISGDSNFVYEMDD